jgi:LPS sulfotransferase NodH
VSGSASGASRPHTSYIVCASPRCGSNLLCEALWSTDVLGRPDEYFLRWHQPERDHTNTGEEAARSWRLPTDAYVAKVIREGTTPNRVFGVKIMWSYFNEVVARLRDLPGVDGVMPLDALTALWPNLHFVHMTRGDKVKQAVSLAKAIQSGRWLDVDRTILRERATRFFSRDLAKLEAYLDQPVPELIYDFAQIDRVYRKVQREDAAWDAFLRDSGARCIRIVYEEFVDSPAQTVGDIAQFLDLPESHPIEPHTFMKKQSDRINVEWTERFCRELIARGEAPVRG